MYCMYQDREDLEDELYQEDDADSAGSEAESELEFHLYSKLHYSSNAGDMEEQEEKGEEREGREGQPTQQPDVNEKTADTEKEQEHTGESRSTSPNINKSRKQPKKKQKKEKSKAEGQRSLSLFEEVIVIDSSPDVISISEGDTVDDDEGVCALKGQGPGRLKTSTPAAQGTQKRKSNRSLPVIVDSSSSESDSEESQSKSEGESFKSSHSSDLSDSTDSDDLENWMMLGRGKQDEDHSISLNLEGGSDSNADGDEEASWLVSDRDKEARIYNKDRGPKMAVQRLSNRYYTSKNVQCRNCNKNGHLSKNCPDPKKIVPCFLCGTPGHLSSECPNRHCNNCGLPGHFYDSCSERAYWHKQCHRCSMTGHFFDACPEIWRQYHITTQNNVPVKQPEEDQGRSPAYCYNCSRKGHFGHACTRRRMFNGTYPSTPFINHYDTVQDINRREHRIKIRVKELKKNGFLTAGPQTPLTPGPPKKKQKLNHQANNHRPNHTPHKSPNNQKPSQSHIFFKDSYDFKGSAAKINKPNNYKQESSGNAKPWKPKRPVPSSKNPPPKLILDEADDFPRGGSKAENKEMNKKRGKMKKKKLAPSGPAGGHGNSRANHSSWTFTRDKKGSKQEKGEKKKKRWSSRSRGDSNKEPDAEMYPRDENLFNIKQRRKRSR